MDYSVTTEVDKCYNYSMLALINESENSLFFLHAVLYGSWYLIFQTGVF
jgi:hypothetical protein